MGLDVCKNLGTDIERRLFPLAIHFFSLYLPFVFFVYLTTLNDDLALCLASLFQTCSCLSNWI